MSVFGNYARYYDLLYSDKNYIAEVDYIYNLLSHYGKSARDILELGCGTGKHALLLAQKGYNISGVDMSENMLESASTRLKLSGQANVSFQQGDIRNVQLHKKFDAILSLFHVFSYLTSNEDLYSAFSTVSKHLSKGGIFIFDCWYGPAVLTSRPEVRIKKLQDDSIQITRVAEPTIDPNNNIVDVNYTIFMKEKLNGNVDEINELHKMRYLFKTEIELLLEKVNMKVEHSEEWMTGYLPSFKTWGVVFICRSV